MTWKTAAVVLAFIVVLAVIVYVRFQKLREAELADVKRMNDLLSAVEAHAARRSDAEGSGLSQDSIRALDSATKIVVVCSFREGRILTDEEGGECAVLLFSGAESYHALYTSGRLEFTARFARRLGKILGLPVEMV